MKYYTQLISTDELAQIQNHNNLVILDASIPPIGGVEPAKYSWPNATISEAKFFDLQSDFSDQSSELSHTFPSIKQFKLSAENLGINNESQIVIYDNLGIYSSARAWWMFKAVGHHNVAVLDGGLPKWINEGRTVKTANKPHENKESFNVQLKPSYFCDAEYVLKSLDDIAVKIVDARARARFNGLTVEPRAGVRSGYIPNAVNLPYGELLESGCFKSTRELTRLFSKLAKPEQSLILSCGSGITACIVALAADLIGFKHISVYDGSWAEWGASTQLPIAKKS